MTEWTKDAVASAIDDDADDALAQLRAALASYPNLEPVAADDFSVRDVETGRVFRIRWEVVDEGIETPEEGDVVVGRPGTPLDDHAPVGAGPGGKILGEVVSIEDGKATVAFSRELNRGTDYCKDLVGDEEVDGIPLAWLERAES